MMAPKPARIPQNAEEEDADGEFEIDFGGRVASGRGAGANEIL